MSVKVSYVRVPAQKATRRKVEKIYCDVGGEHITGHGGYGRTGKCVSCDRDICRKHEKPDPHGFNEDYPDGYCTVCYDIKFVKYGDRQLKLEEQHDKEQNELDRLVRVESLKETEEKL